ncbi:hypothetical protein [Micromonospora rosaria]|nr:hypothetical protein [Micromonospora rosaria]
MIDEATGPEQIRMALAVAIEAAGRQVDEIGGMAVVLDEAADRYEGLGMEATTVEDLRDAGRACGTAQTAVAGAADDLRAALADFNTHDGAVADAVAEAGSLASKELLMGDGFASAPIAATPTSFGGSVDSTPAVGAAGDVLGYADGDTCHGTDRVASVAGPATTLALLDFGDGDDRWDGGRYVAVATSPGTWNPVTSEERTDGSGLSYSYGPPHLDPVEAEVAAGHLDELADLAESGPRPPAATRWGRAAQRLEHVTAGDADMAEEPVMIGDDELPVTVRDLLALLRGKEPATGLSARRHVTTEAMAQAGGDPGALWMDLIEHDGATRIAVTGVEGEESPDSDYWDSYTARHTPEQARALAGRLRTFAREARLRAFGALRLGRGEDAPYLDWSVPTADGGRNLEFGDGHDTVDLDLNPTQLRELHDALTATLTADDLDEAFNAYTPWENDDRYIDWSVFEYETGFQLEIGDGTTAVTVNLTPGQLRAWRDRLATTLTDRS